MHICIKNVFVYFGHNVTTHDLMYFISLVCICICGGDFLGGGMALLTNGGLAAVADQLKSENKTRN